MIIHLKNGDTIMVAGTSNLWNIMAWTHYNCFGVTEREDMLFDLVDWIMEELKRFDKEI